MDSRGIAFGLGAKAVVWQNVHGKLQPRVVNRIPMGIGHPPGRRNSDTRGGCRTAPSVLPRFCATASSLYPLKTSSKLACTGAVSAPELPAHSFLTPDARASSANCRMQ